MIPWRMVIGQFKNSRAEGIKELFYIIMFVYYRIYKKHAWINWQGLLLVTFRTWVRAPGPHFPSYYFFINIHMQLKPWSVSCTFQIQRPRIPGDPINGHDLMNIIFVGQWVHMPAWKVNKGQVLLGLDHYKKPSNLGQTP